MVAPSYVPRLLSLPRQSFFLLGARGTGKSTWVRHELPGDHRIADELRAVRAGTTVVVDEVQRVPALLNEVHRFIEERRMRFVLCGSSARKLKQHGTNLLAGRAVRRQMHPFVPAELGNAFELAAALT